MARKFATDLDLMKFAILNAKAHPVSSDPSGLGAGDEGLFWTNTTTHKFKFWNGTAVIDFTDLANSTGNLTASRISDFDTQVRTSRLDQMATPTSDVGLGGRKITGLADGTAGTDAATYGQLLQMLNNQVFKAPVRAATTANVNTAGGAPNTLDGVTLAANDRILVKDQTTGSQNGIYTVTTLGTGANGTWTRATDADSASELPPGAIVSVQEGTANGDKLFLLATNGPITVGTTSLTFSAYGASSGEIGVAGAGLTKTGSTYDVGAGTGIVVNADNVAVDTARVNRRWAGTIPTSSSTVDGLPITISGAQVTFNHGANNPAPMVVIRAGSSPVSGYTTGEIVEQTDSTTDANNVRITLPAAPAANNWVFGVYA
jgi:phage-related tail fiber protein